MTGARRDTGDDRRPPTYRIESVDNALRLLLLLAERPRIRLTDASTYLGVATSTAHRLLAMLQYRGFVRQDTVSRAYEPGGALTTIASAVLRQVDVRARARPVLERLNTEFDETVHLGRLEGQMVAFLDSIESNRAVRVASRTGRHLPAYCTSTGKAMLSLLAPEELHRLYPDAELEKITERTLATRAALERDLDLTRRRGYAVSMQESEEGVVSVAVPVTSPGGVVYAITVSLPSMRMSAAKRAKIAAALAAASTELAGLLV